MQSARQRVRQRLEESAPAPVMQTGRWAPVHRFGVLGKALSPVEQATVQARQLLARHGVVTHASLDDEIGAWNWGQLYPELQRLELRGEVRRGYFVQGLTGVQFALPAVVEQLRALAATPETAAPLVVMNACDPANLYGALREDGPLSAAGAPLTFARLPSTWLVQDRGLPVLLVEDSGARMTTVQGMDDGAAFAALTAWLAHAATFAAHVQVTSWNDAPVLHSAAQPLLERAGFTRDYPGMRWERRRGQVDGG